MNLLGTFKTEKLDMGQLLWLLYQSSDPAYNDAWKDKGTGQLSIKCKEGVNKGTGEFKPTILVRNDVNGVIMDLSRPGLVLLRGRSRHTKRVFP
ncbi:uncharacterized protein LOC114259989 isoform X2 [Camellia sinensis]|uniref:uncharacterized protein LOC114259989 isoform X2 n=1 Tax=Camellia sinensis TaxID=4442 RepID=UPI001036C5C2|nr:uncharacterized protein LOC114259989 isoform X2 [Camellia sinensis]